MDRREFLSLTRRPVLTTGDALVWGLALSRASISITTTLAPTEQRGFHHLAEARARCCHSRSCSCSRRALDTEITDNLIEEPAICVKLRHIPHHDSPKIAILLRISDSSLELGPTGVTSTSSASVSWNA